jgi:glycosyltransferase involved in cell wall biosynthesis
MRPSRIAFLASSLWTGGAERQLVELACALRRAGHRISVVTFRPGGPFSERLQASGVELLSVGKAGRWDIARFGWRLARQLRALAPEYLLSYLTVPNVFSAALRPLLPGTRLVWGIRASSLELRHYGWGENVAKRLEVLLSRIPSLIVANSHAGADCHVRAGFPAERVTVIPNGIDVATFAPDPVARRKIRGALGYAPSDLVVGCFARLDPMKGHGTLLDAFARTAASFPEAHLLLAGDGSPVIASLIDGVVSSLRLQGRVRRLPSQSHIADYINACDVAVSASAFGEGFSNAIAEAMACGVPCVATNVGDAASIIGDFGSIVPPGDASGLADAIGGMLALAEERRRSLGLRGRQRIVDSFSVDVLVERTQEALAALR